MLVLHQTLEIHPYPILTALTVQPGTSQVISDTLTLVASTLPLSHSQSPTVARVERISGTSDSGQKCPEKDTHPRSQLWSHPSQVHPSPCQAAAPESLERVGSGCGHTATSPQGHPSSWRFMGCLAPTAGWAPIGWSKSCLQAMDFQEKPRTAFNGIQASPPQSFGLDALLIPLPTHTRPASQPGTQSQRP